MPNLAEKYSPLVDEAFQRLSYTNALINTNYEWAGVNTVNVFSVGTSALNTYQMTGTNRYGTPSELDNDVQSLEITQDKGFTFTIDKGNSTAVVGTLDASRALAREVNQVVIPTVDTYRISALVTGAGNVKEEAPTAATAYKLFLDVQELLDEDYAPVAGRVALVTPAYYNLIKQDNSFVLASDLGQSMLLRGQVGEIDGVPVVKVPSSYMSGAHMIITNSIAMVSPIKIQDYKIHIDPVGINGALIEGRIRYDAFILDNKANAIGVLKSPA